jgi:hypothetical protein
MVEFNIKLWSYELTIRDIDALDEDNQGGGGGKGQPSTHMVSYDYLPSLFHFTSDCFF